MTTVDVTDTEVEFRKSGSEVAERPQTPVRVPTRARELAKKVPLPEVVVQSRPTLGDTWRYAKWGVQMGEDGPLRAAAKAWAFASIPVRAALAYLDWIMERPSRFVVFVVLLFVLAQTPWGGFLPWSLR